MKRNFSEAPLSDDELHNLFPELARGRDLIIGLFQTSNVLGILGYQGRQVEIAREVLRTIEQPGLVRGNFLRFGDASKQHADLGILGDEQGYDLWAYRPLHSTSESNPNLRLLLAVFAEEPVPIFDLPVQAAKVNLVKDDRLNQEDLSELVKLFYEKTGLSDTRMFKLSIVTALVQKMGMAATYQANWLNRGKDEFVVELTVPHTQPEYYRWKRLSPLSDAQGSVTSWGEKPNHDQKKLGKLIKERPESIVAGQLVLRPA